MIRSCFAKVAALAIGAALLLPVATVSVAQAADTQASAAPTAAAPSDLTWG
ncbi:MULTISPECIES: hypothetical protein [Kitasatospora]|uniref:Uncharacterized protein n=1 Tax=Kitasatospora cathayae TaxID=3004092 RepID=A0ABY7QF98_9ACTN|nr:hypothetical protein [Kitasatospora sp. HUAS 3-15]WBP91226.1 hypothetical protein O1G21_38680 [Kitasatospora sp. HUAS 3-15]